MTSSEGAGDGAASESPERALALSYAPAGRRAALTALFALDARLREITLVARDPMIGLMRLTWWREALERLGVAPPPAEPLLRALAAEVLPLGVDGAALSTLFEPWERVLDGDVDWAAVARVRGAGVFGLAAVLLGGDDERVSVIGEAWAAVDLARDWPASTIAETLFAGAYRRPWPRALRPLGALGLLARSDAAGRIAPGDPRRVGRLLLHRLTGR